MVHKLQLLMLFLLCAAASSAQAADLRVGVEGDYLTLREALENAKPGDTLLVKPGVYREGSLFIDKPLTLIGEPGAIIDGSAGERDALLVKANEVTVQGFTFRNVAPSAVYDRAALKFEESARCAALDNQFENTFFGIYLAKASDCLVISNRLHGTSRRETLAGNGIHLWSSERITLKKNRIEGHRDGIYFEFVKDSLVSHNVSLKSLRYGLHFMFSDRCTYAHNTFRENGAGVAVMYTSNIEMHHNRFLQNWGPAAYGVLLKELRDSQIHHNEFRKNTTALFVEGSSRVTVESNNIQENGWGVRVMGNAMDNRFLRNNFSGNSFDVATNAGRSFNTFAHNYWSSYRGYDLNRDGVGDVPHRPVRLFSLLVEQNQALLALLHSTFSELMDVAESVFPVLTPETLIDETPSIKRNR